MGRDPRAAFGEALRGWRAEASPPATLKDLAKLLDVSVTSVAKVERGELRPPGRDGCEKIAGRLGRDPDEVWHAAAESLLHFKPYNELRPYLEHRERSARIADLTDDEAALVAALRRQQAEYARRGLGWALPRHLAHVLDALLETLQRDDGPFSGAPGFVVLFARLSGSRSDAIHQLFAILGQLASRRVSFDHVAALADVFRWIREDNAGQPEAPARKPDPLDTYDPFTDE